MLFYKPTYIALVDMLLFMFGYDVCDEVIDNRVCTQQHEHLWNIMKSSSV